MKPEKCIKQGTYLLIYYFKESVANDLKMCHCLLDVNHAIDKWNYRLSACLDAEGGHFEHYLRLLLSR